MTHKGERPPWHGRRKGKSLRARQRDLVADLLPRIRLRPPFDREALFAPPKNDIWLEIGFGGGEHLAARAAASPDIGFIGCEPFVNGVAKLLAQVEDLGLENVRIFDDDARLLLPRMAEAGIGRVFILFPDPWPKKRHWSRRIICTEFLDTVARIMRDGAILRFASDHADYVEWAIERLGDHPDFTLIARHDSRPEDSPPTRYETKALEKGESCAYLDFRRRERIS